MTKLTISEAVKRSGVTRPTFNTRYVKTGLITVTKIGAKEYVKTAELTKALAQTKNKASVKPKSKGPVKGPTKIKTKSPITSKQAASPVPKSPVKKTASTNAKTKASSSKSTEVEKLKLKMKQLRVELKTVIAENELNQKEIASLNRKNANLTRRLSSTTAPVKAKVTTKTKLTRKPLDIESRIEDWVDKWWEKF